LRRNDPQIAKIFSIWVAVCLAGSGGPADAGNGAGFGRELQLQQAAAASSRIKDIASLQAARDNQLIGYGLVVGLQGTGDGLRNSPFTEQSLRAMLQNLGISTEGGAIACQQCRRGDRDRQSAAFRVLGSRVDVTVSSLGTRHRCAAARLVMTSLSGADGQIYAVAQGSVIVSAIQAEGDAATSSRARDRRPAARWRHHRARDTLRPSSSVGGLVYQLRNPDFSTAVGMADVINAYAEARYGGPIAEARDSTTVAVRKPERADLARLTAELEGLIVETDTPARVVVNERTGTIVIGNDVRVSKVAVSHGTLTVQINETPTVVQPLAVLAMA
jgi:flagellar P-ring protein precursor FlgI